MRLGTQRGQQMAEFAILIGMTALVAITMQRFVRKAMSRGVQHVTNVVLGPVVLRANPSTLNRDPSIPNPHVTLTWSVPSATSCTATGGWSGGKLPSGSEDVSPDKTTTYRLSCNDGTNQSVVVTIGSLRVDATQAVDVVGHPNLLRQTTVEETVTGMSKNEDARLRTLQ